jgi:L-2-hydroxyglutarate oxidase LhgO
MGARKELRRQQLRDRPLVTILWDRLADDRRGTVVIIGNTGKGMQIKWNGKKLKMSDSHVIVVGGGIVGLATAIQLTERFSGLSVQVLEKEPGVGAHQTGHNSGVLHSGIYYKPGSLRAQNCRAGKKRMEAFCTEHLIPFDLCGKVIVAVNEEELPDLERILDRGQQNQVLCEVIGPERLRELEPHAAGIRAIHVPEAGIVNFQRVAERMAEIVRQRGGAVHTSTRVTHVRRDGSRMLVLSSNGEFRGDFVVTCAGLHSDRLARLSGEELSSQIVPFRGEYYELKPERHHLCRNLIYPVPNPKFPFLGVHFTRMIEGGVECGPNAVLAFAREGYRLCDVNMRDLAESLGFVGFRRLMRKHWRTGMGELWRSVSKGAFVRALQRLMPEVRSEYLVRGRAGVRAQALGADGNLIDDFVIRVGDRVVHVCNAPSPAATSSLNIGQLVVDQLAPLLAPRG